jgi:hypothetical protein
MSGSFTSAWASDLATTSSHRTSTSQLMARGRHASPAAALRYQHATESQDEDIARGLANSPGNVRSVSDEMAF